MAWINSGIRRLAKEQRIARNKEINVVKASEVVDDATVAANTAAIALNTAKVSMTIGTAIDEAKAGNTITISEGQANAITANSSANTQSEGLCAAMTAFIAEAANEESTLASCAAAYQALIGTTCDEE
jgi:hypothetical protein